MPVAGEFNPGCRSGAIGNSKRFGRTFDDLPDCAPLIVKTGREVEASDTIEAACELVVGVDGTYTGAFAKILCNSAYCEEGALAEVGVSTRKDLPCRSVIDGEQADICVAELAGDAGTELGRIMLRVYTRSIGVEK